MNALKKGMEMKRMILFFSLWNIEKLEQKLKKAEQDGYRIVKVRCSYWFVFKRSEPKDVNFFLSIKSFKGKGMGFCDYALISEHCANEINEKLCYYSLYRTAQSQNMLKLVSEMRMDYIRKLLLEKSLTAFALSVVLIFLLYAMIKTSASIVSIIVSFCFILILSSCLC